MKRVLWSVLMIASVMVTTCLPIINPSQIESPLSRGVADLLPPDGDRTVYATMDEQRSQFGTVPPVSLVLLPKKVMLPLVESHRAYPCNANDMADTLLQLILTYPSQQRQNARCSRLVTETAQMRAEDMVNRRYFSHTDIDGVTPNERLAEVGCLPDYYPKQGNMVESIGMNFFTPQLMLEAFSRSRYHWIHLMGLHPGYANQLLFGVGYARSDERTVFVVMSTVACDS